MTTESRHTGVDHTTSRSSSDSSEPTVDAIELSETDRHRLLASDRRRALLEVLADRTPPIGLEDLATAVAAREADEGRYEGDAGRVAITLHHQHLPILTEFGVVEYEPSENRVRTGHGAVGLP